MKNDFLITVILLMASISFSYAQDLMESSDVILTQSWSQEPNGWDYPIAISIPEVPHPENGFPVCILLHGNGGNGPSMMEWGANLFQQDHILVAPTGYQNSWHLCSEMSNAPDIAMLEDLVSQLQTFDNVDVSHIRLVGNSNGAGLVNQAYIELDIPGVDAFVAIVSQMNEPQYHQDQFHRPSGATEASSDYCGYDDVVVPLQGRKYLSICNENDPVIPYAGGTAVGNFFLPAEVAIHAIAVQQGHFGAPVLGVPVEGSDLIEFSYLEGDIKLIRGEAGHGANSTQLSLASEFLSINEMASICAEDINGDGLISVGDILIVLSDFGCVFSCGNADINLDGIVGVIDILAILSTFGDSCDNSIGIPVVYSESTFSVTKEEGIVYAEGLSHVSLNSSSSTIMPLLLDAYLPDDNAENHPAMVLIHGGGFVGGSRQQGSLVNMANYYASRGWVVFSIDYRLLGDLGTVPEQWVDSINAISPEIGSAGQGMAIYPAHRDAKAALRWVVAYAETYNINPDYITVGGGSAGAITSIGVGVSEPGDYRDELGIDEDPTLLTTHLEVEFEVRTVLDFWGSKISIGALAYVYGLQRFDSGDPSLFIAHGTEDPTVLFSDALELQAVYEMTGVPYILYPLEGFGHGAWNAIVEGETLHELTFQFIIDQQNLIVE
jgi:para-nitrobenzyl esterase